MPALFYKKKMSLTDRAKADVALITSNKRGWGVDIVLTAPTAQVITITGLHTKHHLAYDTDGNAVNTKKAAISFSESFLTAVNYPVRNSAGEVDFKDHLFDVKDSTGILKHYTSQSWFPDEKLGLIVVILQDYE